MPPPSVRDVDFTQVIEWNKGVVRRADDYLAAEEPLEIRSGNSSLGLTMRTPGNDPELVAGFLFTEGIVSRRGQLLSFAITDDARVRKAARANRIQVRLGRGAKIPTRARKFSTGSACGVCGKASIDDLRRRGVRRPGFAFRFDPELLCQLPEKLHAAQPIFGRTGGLHAAALFDSNGELLVLREDIGRHNAVDKVIGWALLQGRIPLENHVCLVSGRGGFEIVQKALVAGVPVLASVSAPSSLAVQLAREMGITLIGFLRGQRFVIYSGEQRVASAIAAPVAGPGSALA